MKDLSVIIPVYNAGLLIDRCLDSIFSQNGAYQVEVICIDDGSTDNSVEIIRQRKESSIRLLMQPNSGPACARNKGITAAEGRYIAFLDADDYWEKGFIEKTLSFLQTHVECIAVSVGQKHITMSGESIVPSCMSEYNVPIVIDDFYKFWARYFHVCTGCIVIRTDVVLATGGQREDLRICEDLEFWALLATYGRFGFIPEVLFVSDGLKVTKEIGWIEKNKRRWASAPTIEEWEKRIISRGLMQSKFYLVVKGRVARNLCYSILLSGRQELAYQQAKKYSKDFPPGRMTTLLRFASKNKIIWYAVACFLTYREYKRK